jgi:hypothetical protein
VLILRQTSKPHALARVAFTYLVRGGPSLPVVGLAVLESAKVLNEGKGRAVELNRINCRPTMEALAPTSGVSGAPLPSARASSVAGISMPSALAVARLIASSNLAASSTGSV